MDRAKKLILATANAHKVGEMKSLLAGCGWAVAAADASVADVPETGDTFAQNARIKAVSVAKATGCVAIADDSGLVVDALNGEPGVHSRRWAGDNASDADRIAKLLDVLRGVAEAKRTAHFVCSACIADPNGILWEGEGRVEGAITEQASGTGGFGYDPVFYVPERGVTMACLSEMDKNKVSHRSRAMSLAAGWLKSQSHGSRGSCPAHKQGE